MSGAEASFYYWQVYSVMRVDALAALVPFATLGDVEQIIVDAIKHNFLAVSTRSY